MDMLDIVIAQLLDPFRIGLLAFLVLTARNTAAHTGWLLPIAAGIVFVAVLIPLTMAPDAENWWMLVGCGLLSNTVVAVAMLVLVLAYDRSRSGSTE